MGGKALARNSDYVLQRHLEPLCLLHDPEDHAQQLHENRYFTIGWLKTLLAHEVLRAGYSVMMMDTDMVVFKNPLSFINGSTDVATTADEHDKLFAPDDPHRHALRVLPVSSICMAPGVQQMQRAFAAVARPSATVACISQTYSWTRRVVAQPNLGMVFFRPTAPSIALMKLWLAEENVTHWDQQSFRWALEEGLMHPGKVIPNLQVQVLLHIMAHQHICVAESTNQQRCSIAGMVIQAYPACRC